MDWWNIKVTKIDRNAFFRCGEMSQIVFPETLNDIGSSAFNRCYQLRRIVIPNGVSIIRESTFFKCSNLKVENKSFDEVIPNFPNDLFYLDPPYYMKKDFNFLRLI